MRYIWKLFIATFCAAEVTTARATAVQHCERCAITECDNKLKTWQGCMVQGPQASAETKASPTENSSTNMIYGVMAHSAKDTYIYFIFFL